MNLYIKISKVDLKFYESQFLECLNHNSNNIYINYVYVYTDDNSLKSDLVNVKVFYTEKLDDFFIINKILINNKTITIFSNPFVKFGSDLFKIDENKLINYVFINNEYKIFKDVRVKLDGTEVVFNKEEKWIRLDHSVVSLIRNYESVFVNPTKLMKKFKKNSIENRLDVIIVSVNYNDYLKLSLENNTKIFDNITVVTSEEDIECQEICENYGVNCLICDNILKDGVINKSIGLNKGIESIKKPDWILILDADIVVNNRIDIKNLEYNNLYTNGRWIIEDINLYNEYKSGNKQLSDFRFEINKGIGFFQLFNFEFKKRYPDSNWGRYSEFSQSDIIFKRGFDKVNSLNLEAIHIGRPYQKWNKIDINKLKSDDSILIIENFIHILIPIYNFENFLKECLDSIIMQNYKKWRCYLFDDGSNDNSANICKYYIDKYIDRFVYIKKDEKNNGPSFSKYYGMKEIEKYSNANDIFMIVDGDDYLIDNNSFNIINKEYIEKKCWMTYGSFRGKWEQQSMDKPTSGNYRVESWRYSHPRTFKCGLIKEFTEDDFKMKGKWLTKGTDRPLVYNSLEWCGNDKISYIKNIIYYYREHDNNTYKIIKNTDIISQKKYVDELDPKEMIKDHINIIMCSWKRTHVLKDVIKSLEKQTVFDRIILHIVNNNVDEIENIKNIIKESKIIIKLSNFDNKNNVFERYIYASKILKENIIDYFIFIDDDQYFETEQIEKLWSIREPMCMVTWYGRLFSNNEPKYWTETKYCHNNSNEEIKYFDYGGVGFSIIDSNIFNEDSFLFNLPNIDIDIKKIDDLWLSYIIKNKYNWNIKRSFLPPKNFTDKETSANSLYLSLKEDKQKLLKYLHEKGWNFTL
jgi:hypothetical protein